MRRIVGVCRPVVPELWPRPAVVGGDQVQMMMGLPAAVGLVLQGMILFPMLAGNLFTEYRLRIVRPEKTPPALATTEEVHP